MTVPTTAAPAACARSPSSSTEASVEGRERAPLATPTIKAFSLATLDES